MGALGNYIEIETLHLLIRTTQEITEDGNILDSFQVIDQIPDVLCPFPPDFRFSQSEIFRPQLLARHRVFGTAAGVVHTLRKLSPIRRARDDSRRARASALEVCGLSRHARMR